MSWPVAGWLYVDSIADFIISVCHITCVHYYKVIWWKNFPSAEYLMDCIFLINLGLWIESVAPTVITNWRHFLTRIIDFLVYITAIEFKKCGLKWNWDLFFTFCTLNFLINSSEIGFIRQYKHVKQPIVKYARQHWHCYNGQSCCR